MSKFIRVILSIFLIIYTPIFFIIKAIYIFHLSRDCWYNVEDIIIDYKWAWKRVWWR